jgi:hypothetical protein
VKRRFATTVAILAAVVTMMPSLAHAGITPGAGTAQIACQIELPLFPVPAASPAAPHHCGGSGNTVVAGLGGAGKDNAAGGGCVWIPLIDKKPNKDGDANVCPGPSPVNTTPSGEGGFEAYNINYNEVCVAGEPLPSQGSASGDGWINNFGLPSLTQGALRFSFTYARVGVAWIATLVNVQETWQPFYKNGAAPVVGAAPGIGVGAGVLLLEPGQPFGTCAAPAATTVWLVGAAVGTV